jgi:hypothetical protein
MPTITAPMIENRAVEPRHLGLSAANGNASALAAGVLCYQSGVVTDSTDPRFGLPKMDKADADAASPANVATHISVEAIASNGNKGSGRFARFALLLNQDTSAWTTVGDPAYLHTTAGVITPTAPTATNANVQVVGYVLAKDATAGKILVNLSGSPISGASIAGLLAGNNAWTGTNDFQNAAGIKADVWSSSTGTTGKQHILITDNLADGFAILEGANNYLKVATSNGGEIMSFGNTTTNPAFQFLGTGGLKADLFQSSTGTTNKFLFSMGDNLATAFDLLEGGNDYLKVNTTNGSEAMSFGNGTTNPIFSFLGTGTVTLNGPLVCNSTTTYSIGASTAAAGTATADATVLPAGTASVYPTTAADDVKGVRVHANDKVTGRSLLIGNGVSNKILKVYPPSGGTINGAAADAAFSGASGKGVEMVCLNSGANTWLAW